MHIIICSRTLRIQIILVWLCIFKIKMKTIATYNVCIICVLLAHVEQYIALKNIDVKISD